MRMRRFSPRTEQAYLHWMRRFHAFHGRRDPVELGAHQVTAFLSSLATRQRVSASTQNQALAALLFLYRDVLEVDLPWLDDLAEATVLLLVALVGAAVGAWITFKLQRARPSAFVNACELSSTFMSLVDYIDMPEPLVAKRDAFPWPIVDREKVHIPDGASAVPLGAASEMLHYLREFPDVADRALNLLDMVLDDLRNRKSDKALITRRLETLCRNQLVVDAFGGSTRRREFRALHSASDPDSAAETLLPWVEDIASGPQVGIMGAYSVHFGGGRVTYVFSWKDEQAALKRASYALAGGDLDLLASLLSELKGRFAEYRATALDLKNWLESNLDPNSKLTLDVTLANRGSTGTLVSPRGDLRISLPGRDPMSITVHSESWDPEAEADKSSHRVVRALLRIGKVLDKPIAVGQWVPREHTFLPPHGEKRITMRSEKRICDIPNATDILHHFRSGGTSAELVLFRIRESIGDEEFTSLRFAFQSSILRRDGGLAAR